ncbi:MAG: type II toxin-antitoxin system PrlF family antitoxin [Cyanobacteria bacterium REEB67]|nr:type II toxin-antitoxin system PrlF family antitoxin [Cyanobacteria bacterium REEB67]
MSYTGKISTSGNSEAIRLDKNLFKQHPEFKQQATVRADVIGPGTILLQVINSVEIDNADDPMVSAFLSFIEKDAISNPANLTPVSAEQMAQVAALTAGVVVTDDDELD